VGFDLIHPSVQAPAAMIVLYIIINFDKLCHFEGKLKVIMPFSVINNRGHFVEFEILTAEVTNVAISGI
jgi:hypothetical protein